MNNNDKIKKSIIENVLVILIMALYIVYGRHYLPLLMIFIPLPFAIVGIRNGINNNSISMAITSLIIGLVLGSPGDMILLLIFAPLSIGLNYFIKKRKKTGETLLLLTLIIFISILILISLGKQSTGIDLVEQIEQAFTQILTIQTDMFKEMGQTNYEIFESTEILESAYKYMLITLPSMFAIISLIIAYFNYLGTVIILRKMGYGVVSLPRFSRFKLPNNIILGTGLMFLTAIIMGKLEIPYHNALLANISVLVGFIFLVQGLSVMDFVLIKGKIKLIFRIIILMINIFIIPMSTILLFVGMLDSIFDMRKIGRAKSL